MNIKNKKTYYQIILDRSGSMGDCIDVTVSGFNEQLQLIRSMKEKFPEQEFVISLTIFNQDVELLLNNANPNEASSLTGQTYIPQGTTALYDAIGKSVLKLQDLAGKEIEKDEATAVVVIITDGHENASRHFNFQTVSNLIKELDAQKNWTFSYLGATIDAVDIAASLNVKRDNSISFSKESSKKTWDLLRSSKLSYYRNKSKGVVNEKLMLTEEEKDNQLDL